MPNPSGKINHRERAICARVKEFREAINWSQSDFAAQLGLRLNQLASIEYGRTPLRYEIAWKIRSLFGLGLEWLADGNLAPDEMITDNFPPPGTTGVSKSALLSEISDAFNGASDTTNLTSGKNKFGGKVKLNADEFANRVYALRNLKAELEVWFARVQDGRISGLSAKIIQAGFEYLLEAPEDSTDLVNARHAALLWEKIRDQINFRLAGQKQGLTNVSLSGNNPSVKAQLPGLLKRLNEATKERGTKTALAKFMGVKPPNVSQWLSGEKEPGGENTLKLLHWVEQQERQK